MEQEIINSYSKLSSLNVSRETFSDLENYTSMILEKNKEINLISHKSAEKNVFFDRHLLDSAQIIDFVNLNCNTTTDLGSGSGMPGIIIAIILKNIKKKMKIYLYEKSHYKSHFLRDVSKKLKTDFIPTSADSNKNINQLKERIYNELQFIRVYLRPKGGETDFKEPLIVRKGNTVADVCNKLHRNMKKDFRFGLVWGKSVKFGGQRVSLNHVLIDEDVLTVVKKR